MVEADEGVAAGGEEVGDGFHGAFVGGPFEAGVVRFHDEPLPGGVLEAGHLLLGPLPGLGKYLKMRRIHNDVQVFGARKLQDDGVSRDADVFLGKLLKVDTRPHRPVRNDDQMVVDILPETVPGDGAQRGGGEGVGLFCVEYHLVVETSRGQLPEAADAGGDDGGVLDDEFMLFVPAPPKEKQTPCEKQDDQDDGRPERKSDFLLFHGRPYLKTTSTVVNSSL